jgi:GT2 family glycosyltransferase
MSQVGIVVPTVFSRPEQLPEALRSIRESGNAYVLIVSPEPKGPNSEFTSVIADDGLVNEFLTEQPGLPLATNIDLALNALPKEVEFIGWLGDDDLLEPGALDLARQTLESDPNVVMVYGDCRYIDQDGNDLFINRSGEVARKLLGYGPQLIPQPGALWRRDAFEAVGGLSADFDLAFDYDLFMKLKRHGRISYIPQTLASFRWHADSLSVKSRWKSAREASRVRIRHQRGPEKLLILLEPAIILATWVAGKLVTRFRLSPSRSNQSK